MFGGALITIGTLLPVTSAGSGRSFRAVPANMTHIQGAIFFGRVGVGFCGGVAGRKNMLPPWDSGRYTSGSCPPVLHPLSALYRLPRWSSMAAFGWIGTAVAAHAPPPPHYETLAARPCHMLDAFPLPPRLRSLAAFCCTCTMLRPTYKPVCRFRRVQRVCLNDACCRDTRAGAGRACSLVSRWVPLPPPSIPLATNAG